MSVPRVALAVVVVAAVGLAPACSKLAGLVKLAPTPVQLVQAEADATDAANQLGAIVEQLAQSCHKLHQAGVLPRSVDDAVQNAATSFANLKDTAITNITAANSTIDLVGTLAPIIGAATTVTTALSGVTSGMASALTGAAAVVAGPIPGLVSTAQSLIAKLGGG